MAAYDFSKTAEYKDYLKSLTTRELHKLADNAGIDIPPDLDRIFIVRELLDNAIEEERSLDYLSEKSDLKTAALPGQYHINYLEVLVRDPQWVYVFWEIKAQDRERYEADPRFEGYVLKILECKTLHKDCSKNPPEDPTDEFKEYFTVPVKPEDRSRYLAIPSGGVFRIAFWIQGLETSLMLSRSFELPNFLNKQEDREYFSSPVIQLCGISTLAILRDSDRISRNRIL